MPTVLIVIIGILAALLLAEVVARAVFGMGDPPLWMDDPETEYRAHPSKSYRRYGNRISYNSCSMRNPDFPHRKSDPNEVRIMVVGDSIVDGGATLDQDALATSLLEKRLAQSLQRPVIVGNIASRGWAPPHYCAYVRKFGLFDADLVVILINSGDYDQVPAFRRRRAKRKPLFALQDLWREGVRKYHIASDNRRFKPDEATHKKNIEICLEALMEVIEIARAKGADVLMAQHLWRSEVTGEREIGHHEILRVAREMGIEPVQLGDGFAQTISEGSELYLKDGRHPNELGHERIADILYDPIHEAITSPSG